ncbi:hypothetical protein [Aquisalibacillus elongatus]|uniref:Uncharacterized protein n=1 Tax=Aquisalibacillus elongatus TaxID=485577 RepID=A0A3N5BR88_9BACI|nr:hypothetical protein [Aquisalibacillus elongatus]RPF52228.1 hypothetical protein EDC24_2220 [Aquisalibacillus elongatus]
MREFLFIGLVIISAIILYLLIRNERDENNAITRRGYYKVLIFIISSIVIGFFAGLLFV